MWKLNGKYKITYDLNGGQGGPSSPQTGEQIGGEITLEARWPSRDNYAFVGWCTQPTDSWPCDGESYSPGTTYALDKGYEVTFYGMWTKIGGDMQSFSCGSLSNNQVTALKDTRDNEIYTIARLEDGKCWMTQSLRYYSLSKNISNAADPHIYGRFYTWNNSKNACPSGWRLPTKTDVDWVVSAYTAVNIYNPLFNFTRGGYFAGERFQEYVGLDAQYAWIWTSTPCGHTANTLYAQSTGTPQMGVSCNDGDISMADYALNMRCLKN